MPAYARLTRGAIDAVRDQMAADEETTREQLNQAFENFEQNQPQIADRVGQVLSKALDETALALGYFLSLSVWLMFERALPQQLNTVSPAELEATIELIALDEELRRSDPTEAIDTDDIIATEQPEVLAFVHEHVDATLETHAGEIDVDDVHEIYHVVLVQVLALSYAVRRPAGFPIGQSEMLA